MKIGIGTAHGKIILIGEHAVVYGEKAIALPFFPTNCTVTVSNSQESRISSSLYNGIIDTSPIELEAIVTLIKELTKELHLPNLHFKIKSNISIGAGMGSSAAIASAIISAVYNFLDIELSNETRFNWIQFSETIAHGSPSGIDALTTTHDNAWIFQKGQKPIEFDTKINAFLIVGQTGEIGNTKLAVSHVKRIVDEKNKMNLIHEIGEQVEAAHLAYRIGDLNKLGATLNKTQNNLKILGVSTTKIDRLVDMALDNGAVGAKLTGGGLGGCVIALAKNEDIADEIKNAWEKESQLQAWVLNLNEVSE